MLRWMPVAEPIKRIDDVVIHDLSERDSMGNVVPLYRIDSVCLYSLGDAEATGRAMAERKSVSLWLQRGFDAVTLIASYRKTRGSRRREEAKLAQPSS